MHPTLHRIQNSSNFHQLIVLIMLFRPILGLLSFRAIFRLLHITALIFQKS
nr:MAG TPA: hypothetical protein [Caudoviricetes sp.]